MFRGRYEHTIDTKGRLSIPSKFREILASQTEEKLILTNFDQCLWAYSPHEWQSLEEKIGNLPQFREEIRILQRFFISSATEAPLDPQGRIIIPVPLRRYAGLTENVVLVGMTKRIEIWSAERWQLTFTEAEREIGKLSTKLADLGL